MRPQYQIAASGGAPYGQTPSAISPSYGDYTSGGGGAGGSGYTNYGGMARPSFTPVSTPQPGSSNQSFSR